MPLVEFRILSIGWWCGVVYMYKHLCVLLCVVRAFVHFVWMYVLPYTRKGRISECGKCFCAVDYDSLPLPLLSPSPSLPPTAGGGCGKSDCACGDSCKCPPGSCAEADCCKPCAK